MARSVPGLGSGSTRPLLYTHEYHWQPDPQVLDSPDYDKGVTQHIEVYKGEDSIGGKDDPATYGEPHRNHHPASTMEGIAKILEGEIVRHWLAVRRT